MSEGVDDWLKGLGLERYAQAFRENDIDRDVLPEFTARRYQQEAAKLDSGKLPWSRQ
jgi:hypothetical protein